MEKINLQALQKRSLKKFIPELEDRDDFDYELFTKKCNKCGREDQGYRYQFYGEENWRTYDSAGQCKECDLDDYLSASQQEHIQRVNEAVMGRYWYIPQDLEVAGFKNFNKTNSVTTKGLEICSKYASEFKLSEENRHNLLIMGNPGTGKSHLAVAIARNLKASGFTVGFLTTGKLLSLIKETYKKGASRTEIDIQNDISKLDVLILDDLGAEATKDEFSWSKTQMFDLLNIRSKKPTIYTTNFNDENIAEAVGERVASRLYKNSKFIDMFTDDYRKNFKII